MNTELRKKISFYQKVVSVNLLFWLVLLLACINSLNGNTSDDLIAPGEEANEESEVGRVKRELRPYKSKSMKELIQDDCHYLIWSDTGIEELDVKGDMLRYAQWCAEKLKFKACLEAIPFECKDLCPAKEKSFPNLSDFELEVIISTDYYDTCDPCCYLRSNRCLAFEKKMNEIDMDKWDKGLKKDIACEKLLTRNIVRFKIQAMYMNISITSVK